MRRWFLFILIYAAFIGYVAFLGFQNRVWIDVFKSINETLSQGYSLSGHNEWVGSAVSILETRTFNFGQEGAYIGQARKDPVYPLILAAAFRVFGSRVWVLYAVNLIFLAVAVFLTWKVASHLLPGDWPFIPTAIVALYPGAVSQVWVPNSEAVALAIFLFFTSHFFSYRGVPRVFSLTLFSVAYALTVLLKPILLYTVPLFLTYIIILEIKRLRPWTLLVHTGILLIILCVIVGGWMYRNYKVLGSWQIGDGGHSLLRRASQVNFTRPEIISAALSFTVGDIIGEKLYSSFPRGRSPLYWDPIVEQKWYLKYLSDKEIGHHVYLIDGERVTRIEIDRRLYREAIQLIKTNPTKFFATSPLGFFRLDAPIAYNGQEFMRFMAGRESIPLSFRIGIILAIRICWYIFMILALAGLMGRVRDRQFWGVLILFVFSVNVFYGVFTHAEARYLLTVIPFYAIAAAEAVRVRFT